MSASIPIAAIPYFQVPVIHVGPLAVHGFGILVAMGFLFGGNAAMKRADRSGLQGEKINQLITWLIAGTFIGGHVGYGLMYRFDEYMADPIQFLYFWQGLSSFGGFLVCVPLSIWFFHRHKLPVAPYMDAVGIGLALGWFFGRMGCTVAHDHPGTPSSFFLAKYCRPVEGHTLVLPDFMVDNAHPHDLRWGPCQDGGAAVTSIENMVPMDFDGVLSAHDMGFYEALWSLAVFALFLWLDRTPRKPGFFITLLGVLYGPVRFFMDELRPDSTDGRWFQDTAFAMTPGQFWSVIFFFGSIYVFVRVLQSDKPPVGPASPWIDPDRRPPPDPASVDGP